MLRKLSGGFHRTLALHKYEKIKPLEILKFSKYTILHHCVVFVKMFWFWLEKVTRSCGWFKWPFRMVGGCLRKLGFDHKQRCQADLGGETNQMTKEKMTILWYRVGAGVGPTTVLLRGGPLKSLAQIIPIFYKIPPSSTESFGNTYLSNFWCT